VESTRTRLDAVVFQGHRVIAAWVAGHREDEWRQQGDNDLPGLGVILLGHQTKKGLGPKRQVLDSTAKSLVGGTGIEPVTPAV
jgi:hypothetical protein